MGFIIYAVFMHHVSQFLESFHEARTQELSPHLFAGHDCGYDSGCPFLRKILGTRLSTMAVLVKL
jgi:hypothetical protein